MGGCWGTASGGCPVTLGPVELWAALARLLRAALISYFPCISGQRRSFPRFAVPDGGWREARQSLMPPPHVLHTRISSVEPVSVLPMNWCCFYGMLCYKDQSSPS